MLDKEETNQKTTCLRINTDVENFYSLFFIFLDGRKKKKTRLTLQKQGVTTETQSVLVSVVRVIPS